MNKIKYLILILSIASCYSQDFKGIIEIENDKCFGVNNLKLVFQNEEQIVLRKLDENRFEVPLERINNIDAKERIKLVVEGKKKYFVLPLLENSFDRCTVRLEILKKKRKEIEVAFTNCSGVVLQGMEDLLRKNN